MLDTMEQRSRVTAATDAVPAKLAHVVLKTSNFRPMVQWYIDLLNARIALANDDLAFLTFDHEHHRIAIANVPRLVPSTQTQCGLDHIAFTFDDLGKLLSTYLRLREKGIRPSWCIAHGVTTSFYYKDPDGNKVEMQFDNFATEAELQNYFETDPDFAKNPLGAPFDPDQLIAAYNAGEPISALRKVPPYPDGMTPYDILSEMGLTSKVD